MDAPHWSTIYICNWNIFLQWPSLYEAYLKVCLLLLPLSFQLKENKLLSESNILSISSPHPIIPNSTSLENRKSRAHMLLNDWKRSYSMGPFISLPPICEKEFWFRAHFKVFLLERVFIISFWFYVKKFTSVPFLCDTMGNVCLFLIHCKHYWTQL